MAPIALTGYVNKFLTALNALCMYDRFIIDIFWKVISHLFFSLY